ncbi:WD40 repeat domain-containing protein [Amycolatopsis sp.]|uniref:WD40 repeat domain-containing protein n=1 Tax=Amycolatopsis sp. TaxID=37632 RepID=UPI0039C8BA2D
MIGHAKIFDVATGREVLRIRHSQSVHTLAFSPDGTRLATAGDDKFLELGDMVRSPASSALEASSVSGVVWMMSPLVPVSRNPSLPKSLRIHVLGSGRNGPPALARSISMFTCVVLLRSSASSWSASTLVVPNMIWARVSLIFSFVTEIHLPSRWNRMSVPVSLTGVPFASCENFHESPTTAPPSPRVKVPAVVGLKVCPRFSSSFFDSGGPPRAGTVFVSFSFTKTLSSPIGCTRPLSTTVDASGTNSSFRSVASGPMSGDSSASSAGCFGKGASLTRLSRLASSLLLMRL